MPAPRSSLGGLIPEPQISFSAELARAVGVEGAVLIQQIKSVYQHQPATARDGLAWLHVSHAYLLELMPFWSPEQLLSICDAVEELGLLRIDRQHGASGCLLLAIDEGGVRSPAPAPSAPPPSAYPEHKRTPTRQKSAAERALPRSGTGEPLPPDFTPSEDMLELLERFHGVPRGFALAQLEDFTLYWRERGSAGHAWQNRFKQHVLWHWKRHQQEHAGLARGGVHGGGHTAGGARRTRDSSLEHDLTDTSWAD
ncbi:MAG: DnaT-like ssDNA-binding domain-containing protein [Pseudomonadota bacterium]